MRKYVLEAGLSLLYITFLLGGCQPYTPNNASKPRQAEMTFSQESKLTIDGVVYHLEECTSHYALYYSADKLHTHYRLFDC